MADVVIMPKLGFDMAEGTLIRWVKAEGEAVEKGELLAEIETDKATVEVESMFGGVVRKHLVAENAIVPVNTPIAVVGGAEEAIDFDALVGGAAAEVVTEAPTPPEETATAPAPTPAHVPAAAVPAAVPSDSDGRLPGGVKASPVARRMASEHGVDLLSVSGSGPGGRVVKSDVEAFLAAPQEAVAPTVIPSLPALAPAQVDAAPADQIVPLSRLRGAIGRRMTQAKQQIPHFYVTHEYDMGEVMRTRKQANAMLGGAGEKLSVNDFILKAAALALRQYPNLNASLKGDSVVQHGQVNIGVAVAVEGGLLTVVCKDADRKSLRQLSSEVRQMAERARQGKVRPEDIEGSTFSVSNLGMYGTDHFIAIINPPEAAILAVGKVQQTPVVVDGEIAVGTRMQATVSVDHRVSDGAEAAQFMRALGEYLENPLSLML